MNQFFLKKSLRKFSRKFENILPDLFLKVFEIIESPTALKHHPFVNRIKLLAIPSAEKKVERLKITFSVVEKHNS